ncbi:MAG: aldehyde dehydrogenase family protein [Pirellulales bacterium]
MPNEVKMIPKYPLYLANRPLTPNAKLAVTCKATGETIAQVPLADDALIDKAIAAAVDARSAMQSMKPFERQAVLMHCVRRFEERSAELAEYLCREAGKPMQFSRGEVTRLIDTFRVAAEESVRIDGDVLNLEISPRAAGYRGFVKRVPIGVCSFISPFNFPLNLAAHKIAPAIAAGCPFVLKPASLTPLGALLIGEVLAETDLPAGAFSILPTERSAAGRLTSDERIALLSFTGSPEVGWALKAQAGKKQVILELGGNAGCIVDEDANIADTAARLTIGAFYQSGQSCISVQRILVHRSIIDSLRKELIARAEALRIGDPRDEATFIGPLITESEAVRVEEWVDHAVASGAKLLCGGKRDGAYYSPTLLENVPEQESVVCREVFGPVAVLSAFDKFDDALEQINRSRYGLQAGIFTNNLAHAMKAWDKLEVGGVIVGDVPSWRVDNMPYGGIKESGLGREGIRSAIEHLTEPRLLVIRT